MKDNIKTLFERVIDKKGFIKILSDEYNRSESGIRSNWMSAFSIPDYALNRVHELLINFVRAEANKTLKMT